MIEDKIKKDLEQSIKNSKDIVSNMSRFYTKLNKVVGNKLILLCSNIKL